MYDMVPSCHTIWVQPHSTGYLPMHNWEQLQLEAPKSRTNFIVCVRRNIPDNLDGHISEFMHLLSAIRCLGTLDSIKDLDLHVSRSSSA